MTALKPKAGILDIAPYIGGESKAKGGQRIVKLSSNESALGPCPKAIEALKNMAVNVHRYPDGGSTELRAALGRKNKIDPELIVCGAGSDEIISFLCQSYTGEGDEVLYSAHGFLMYAISAKANGATPVAVSEKNLNADLDAMLGAVNKKTKIVFLTNPNNPTGSLIKKADIRKFCEKLPKDVLLVLDCAYAEFVEDSDYSAGHELVSEFGNVVVLRTFSKIYGMAGLRLGWGHCPPAVADVLNRVRGPFNVSLEAQEAGLAALGDDDFVSRAVAHNSKWLKWTSDKLSGMGLKVYPSAGNFVLVSFGAAEKAEACRLFLKDNGVLVRQMGGYKLPECLRITIGASDEMELACQSIKEYLDQA